MTNPGHVDPGYAGRLRFTVINVGKEDIPLRRGDVIVTLLVIQLQGNSTQNWRQRHANIARSVGPSQEEVDRLSLDFLDVQGRATTAANAAVANAEFIAKWKVAIISAAIPVLVALIGGFFAVWQPLQQTKKDIEVINKVLAIKEPKSRIDEVEQLKAKIEALEQRLRGSTQLPAAPDSPSRSTP
jgi:hypothetical protein